MKISSLLVVLLSLTLGIATEANAKRGGSSHGSAHSTPHGTAESHAATEGGSSTSIKNSGTGQRHSDGNPVAAEGAASAQPVSTATGSNNANAMTPGALASKIEMAAAEAQKKQHAEQAAAAAAEANKRRDAELREQRQQEALAEREKRQIAWAARCDIKPVMTDLEIATCREVMTRPAP